ncbi:hypothetical protein F2P79_006988 [Pimephales promelas]|nr:hypothetical protein F2P79_006988 [Pimephales promelas]
MNRLQCEEGPSPSPKHPKMDSIALFTCCACVCVCVWERSRKEIVFERTTTFQPGSDSDGFSVPERTLEENRVKLVFILDTTTASLKCNGTVVSEPTNLNEMHIYKFSDLSCVCLSLFPEESLFSFTRLTFKGLHLNGF